MPKKLLFIVNVDWFFLSHRLPIAIAAKNEGYEIHVACKMTSRGAQLQNYGFILHDLNIDRSGIGLLSEFKTFNAIRKVLKKIRPSIVHTVTIKPVIYAGLANRFFNIASVSSISGLGFLFIAEGRWAKVRQEIIICIYKLALRRRRASVIFQNPTDREMFLKKRIIDEEQALIIKGSGVNLDDYDVVAAPDEQPIVMLLARLLVDKGVGEFVEAAKLLKAQGVSCRMILVGDVDDNPKSITHYQLESWERDGLIEYWGFRSNVSKAYAQANIIVLPSYREGLPKSLIEAAACGRPVITTDVPGCRDAIVVNITGLLVPPKNADALANAIAKLCNDKELCKKFGQEGRRLAESDFDIRIVISAHLNLYKRLLETQDAK